MRVVGDRGGSAVSERGAEFDSARGESALGGCRDWSRVTVWLAGLLVAAGAGAATAHGLFEVARAAAVSGGIAWLYPGITDGLALVAYVATTRLSGHGRSYGWGVVVLAASLSGLAQAAYLAGGVATATPVLRFGVGAWPAIAAALAAHLLFLLAHTHPATGAAVELAGVASSPNSVAVGHPVHMDHEESPEGDLVEHAGCPNSDQLVRSVPGVPTDLAGGVPGVPVGHPDPVPFDHAGSVGMSQPERRGGLRPALSPTDRALAVAELRRRQAGGLPSVRELAELAQVGRGTADRALRELRAGPEGLWLVGEPASGVGADDQEHPQS